MIKFFRKIRQNWLMENPPAGRAGKTGSSAEASAKVGKYLKYAIGEIILVVVGILIAVQINNWNENRKAKDKQVKLLIELKQDLIDTKDDLITDIEKVKQILATTNTFYKAIVEDRISETNPFILSTSYILNNAVLFPKLSAYEAIQSEGITIISNDELRKKITDFYQLHLKRVSAAEAFLENIDHIELKPHLNEFSHFGDNCKDCEDLYGLYRLEKETELNLYLIYYADDKLIHILKEKFNVLRTLNQRYLDLSLFIDNIIVSIDQETNNQ